MKQYLADTNVILRYLLNDIPSQADQIEKYFQQAKKGSISIFISVLVFVEINFAFKKFYRLKKSESIDKLALIAQIPYLDIEMRDIVLKALNIYTNSNFEFVDCLFLSQAQITGKELLTFDQKLKRFKV